MNDVGLGMVATVVAATVGAVILTRLNWRGTVMFVPAAVAVAVLPFTVVALWVFAWAILCGATREYWRWEDLSKGQDKSRHAREAIGAWSLLRNVRDRRRVARGAFACDGKYPVGTDQSGAVVCLPLGLGAGRHSLVVGATGSGKTTTMLAAVTAHVEAGCGVVAIDPKGDQAMVDRLRDLATTTNRDFRCFSLTGESNHWNPLAQGTPSERGDKLIATEEWTEDHYKRFYQRYLLTVFTAIDARHQTPELATVVDLLHPERLALYARDIQNQAAAERIDRYLVDLTDQERRDLAGLRNRVALIAESEHGHLLCEVDDSPSIDLLSAVCARAIVIFSLNSSRYPEVAKLLGAAVFQDLKNVAGVLETDPELRAPCAIVVDEFSAFAQDHVLGLLQRARSAHLSLMLATQELADLRRVDPAFQDQVLGNVETIIAHRQNVPDSAELIAQIAGTRDAWIHTFTTEQGAGWRSSSAGLQGTKRRGHEFRVAPDTIKQLEVGQAVVIAKNPHTVHITRVRPTSGTSPTNPSTWP